MDPHPDAGPVNDRHGVIAISTGVRSRTDAQLLAFPLNGEALLRSIAELVRHRVAGGMDAIDPFLLKLSTRPHPMLQIDSAVRVECSADRSWYRVVVGAAAARVTIETTDLATLFEFVGDYVNAKLSDLAQMEQPL